MENVGNKRKVEIAFDTIKRIAKATPDLTVAQFVAVWTEKIAEERREMDRERKTEKPGIEAEKPGIGMENAGMTYQQREAKFYADMRAICGRNTGGLTSTLLKIHNHQIDAARAVLERARVASDPKAFIAAACNRGKNGSGNGVMDAFDQLIDRTGSGPIGDSPEMVDVTPAGGHSG